jgi:hypothetical protein
MISEYADMKRKRQKVKVKRQKSGEATFIKSALSRTFAFYLLPFAFSVLRR